jgi:hypothetical protein
LINNRQGGRRRGRGGGQRGQNLGGNRQDNRQRGNAAQLLEKYKNMARDAQLAGDRVQSEYYLQFADHYFRVLGESRSRFEDQRRQRDDDSADEDEIEEEGVDAAEEERSDDEPRARRGDDEPRGRRGNGRDRPRRNGAPPVEADPAADVESGERIAVEALPPSIGRDVESSEDEPAPKPRRRTRRAPPTDGETEIAPAA